LRAVPDTDDACVLVDLFSRPALGTRRVAAASIEARRQHGRSVELWLQV